MITWPWVVLPAVFTALAIRVDAALIGPYFSSSSLIYGWEGLAGEVDSTKETLKWAVVRRFAYPVLLGLIMGLSGVGLVDTGITGVLAAGLLLWPIVFHGLPWGVSRRDWQVPALYALLLGLFFGLSVFGWYCIELMRSAADGDVWSYFFSTMRDWLLTLVISLFGLAFFKGSWLSLKQRIHMREDRATEGRIEEEDDAVFRDDEL